MRNTGSLFIGILLIAFGVVFLLDNLGYVDSEYAIEKFWPLILVFVGASLLFRKPSPTVLKDKESSIGDKGLSESNADFLVGSAIFGNLQANVTSKNFKGGSCSVVFGEIDIDLRSAELNQGQSMLKLNGVFGSIEVDVPPGMEMRVQANLVAGQIVVKDVQKGGLFENLMYETPGYKEADRKLFIIASHVFGELRIQQSA